MESPAELPHILEQALTGCMVLFNCLESEVHHVTSGTTDPGGIRWRARVKFLWNESKMNGLLAALRGQQTAINLLIQLPQMLEPLLLRFTYASGLY